ncbi:MAG: membrane protein insertion efficiency factor YidD [Clostridia bacterium]|nr:membrane protein insertion efficiency factor YidD [Clostridia bacterium]
MRQARRLLKKNRFTAFLRGVWELPRRCLILPIKLYRRVISPLKGTPSCRFTPSCSQYAIEAITEWGVIAGLALAVWRVLRCNPFGGCGYDPVPKRKGKTSKDASDVSDVRSESEEPSKNG